jgi:hypothetical protein
MSNQWHYSEEGAQYGPVDESEIVSLISSGKISPSTLVCEEGKMHWQPAREVSCFQVEIFLGSPTAGPATPDVPQSAESGQGYSSPQSAPGSAQNPAGQFPIQAAGTSPGKNAALGVGGLLVVGLLLWGAYSFFFGSLSPEGLGEEVFDALVDNDADGYVSDCTPMGYSRKKLNKYMMKFMKARLDHEVENGKITVGERDRRLIEFEKEFDEAFDDKKMEEATKGIRESFKETIDRGKSAGLNWSKAKFEFIDDSEFKTSKSEEEDGEKIPKGYGGGDINIVVSEGGKRYRIEMDDCLQVPGYGCLNSDGLRWIGEIK